MGKKCGKFKFFQKVSTKISIFSKNHGYLDDLDKNLDTAKSQLKNLNFKNLDRAKKKFGLDR